MVEIESIDCFSHERGGGLPIVSLKSLPSFLRPLTLWASNSITNLNSKLLADRDFSQNKKKDNKNKTDIF